MAVIAPLTSPWIISTPDANENTIDVGTILNSKIHPQLGVRIILEKFSAPMQFRVVHVDAPANQIDASNPSYTTTDDPLVLTVHPSQEIRVKAGAGAVTCNLTT